MRAIGVVGALAFVGPPCDARAARPKGIDPSWAGLDAPAARAHADGVRTLRAPASGRVRIPSGTFVMGSSPLAMARAIELCQAQIRGAECTDPRLVAQVRAEGVAHPVTISTFEMDRTEVTVARYAECVAEGPCVPAEIVPGDHRFDGAELPVTHVRWEDGATFCRWTGGRLPTEAEWEYAARGVEGRGFPWGNVYSTRLANHGAWATDRTDATDGFAWLAPVGSFPEGATPLGLLDMAGNVAEWVADVLRYDADGLPVGYSAEPEADPKPVVAGGGTHVIRGGSYADAPMWLRSAARDTTSLARSALVGFRCAADVR
jgi:formylglycine-generating enzyme required for sulfatase activity